MTLDESKGSHGTHADFHGPGRPNPGAFVLRSRPICPASDFDSFASAPSGTGDAMPAASSVRQRSGESLSWLSSLLPGWRRRQSR